MRPPNIPVNAYTNSPSQHPNLLLGSLQMMFWLVLRPSAWKNHIQKIDLSLDKNFLLLELLTSQRWEKEQTSRFIIQVFIILPTLLNLTGGAVFLSLGAPPVQVLLGLAIGMSVGILGGIVVGMVFGVAVGAAFNIVVSISSSVIVGMAGTVAIVAVIGLVLGVAIAVAFEITGGIPGGVDVGISIFISLIIVFGIKLDRLGGLVGGLAFAMGLWINWWRPSSMATLLIPWHTLLYYIDKNRTGNSYSLLYKNLAFWDEWQYLPIWGLDKHLLLVLDRNPSEGQVALNYLSTSRQCWAARSVQIELDARQLEYCADIFAIGQIQQIFNVRELYTYQIEYYIDAFTDGQIQHILTIEDIFESFNSISIGVDLGLGHYSIYQQQYALISIDNRLNNLVRELTKRNDKYAMRFRPIAQHWQNIISLYLQDLIEDFEMLKEIDSPYIIGTPIINNKQLFVGRTDIIQRLAKLILDRRSPPLLLYGQRRTGKTSLLNNIGTILPSNIIPLFIDLQGSTTRASDHIGFLYNLAKGMKDSAKKQRNLTLPILARETLADDPFSRFDEWLDRCEIALGNNMALLTLDEFEVLDRVLSEGRFNENDVLGMLRNLIQHRPKFKVLLAGSHTLDEFQRWSSYLINAQVIHLGYLQEAEARQLIETPIENFALRYEPSASQRVLDITKGHPFLVQLLCAEIVALKNDQDPSIRRLATLADVEAAIPEALEHGSMFFSDIERNQLDAQSLQVLRYFAQQGEAATISKSELEQRFSAGLEGAIDLLLRRELLEIQPAGYSIQLELIRQWFDRP
jgi:hypothetical protein